jgi:general secretion pathway protein G
MEEVPKDPWGRTYEYRQPAERSGKAYDVFSLGKDGVESPDDIGNWKHGAMSPAS